jgi:hypothetical protein
MHDVGAALAIEGIGPDIAGGLAQLRSADFNH